jgi:hypothetical protein
VGRVEQRWGEVKKLETQERLRRVVRIIEKS